MENVERLTLPSDNRLAGLLLDRPEVAGSEALRRLVPIVTVAAGASSAGRPFLGRQAWELFRDRTPLLFGFGLELLRALEVLPRVSSSVGASDDESANLDRASQVVRQVVLTAAITAPPVLWLLRHVLGAFSELGLLEHLLAGDAIYPGQCFGRHDPTCRLQAEELDTDLRFLLSTGMVEQYEQSFRIAGHPRVREIFEAVAPLPAHIPADVTRLWRQLFAGEMLADDDLEALLDLGGRTAQRRRWRQNHWIPTLEELEIGYRLVPIVLGLRANNLPSDLETGHLVRADELSSAHPAAAGGALELLTAAGWLERGGDRYRLTRIGERGFTRGPGPFGIIESYHGYMDGAAEILRHGRSHTWVERGENVGASQDANRATFAAANDSLDRFCADTGFSYQVFIEHAIGRGEATRQRYQRSGDLLSYFGADLEDAAIDAAVGQQRQGVLPPGMIFVRRADIGRPQALLEALAAHGADADGAVMLVGNGFHEVRDQTDEGMTAVFRDYERAGIVLLFTEENALSIDDLRATAWNTYHAGFKYVHEKSGQGLRPAEPGPPVRLGQPLRAAWSHCAATAGYVRADAYSTRTRTIYPYPPSRGHNPAISVNHFFLPQRLAARLELI